MLTGFQIENWCNFGYVSIEKETYEEHRFGSNGLISLNVSDVFMPKQ
jgi:hypothetical protein